MAEFTLCVALQAAILSTGADNYEQAYQDAAANGKPLVVLVGADWCPGCRDMKNTTMPSLQRRGQLDGVAFASVNTDRDGRLAQKLMQGGTIPQLILFTRTSAGWKRMQLTGAQDESSVRSMIRRGIELYEPVQPRELASAGGG